MQIAVAVAVLAAVAWAYLLLCHGWFWRTDQRLPPAPGEPARWPAVAAVIPARDEAAMLPVTLPTLLGQQYRGRLTVIVVDDDSSDGTAEVAAALGQSELARNEDARPEAAHNQDARPEAAHNQDARPELAHSKRGRAPLVISGSATPPGWAGKVWAMQQGLDAVASIGADAEYILFTDADIAFGPHTLAALVRSAVAGQRALVSQMALLRADTRWERLLVPAFVYFFAQLYPFRRVNRAGSRTAAAAGGCMLVHREVLAAAGGLAEIRGARIDDVALGRLLKRGQGANCWLGLSVAVTSQRRYARAGEVWDMVARSAYTQLRYSPTVLVATIAGLAWLYLVPPAAALAGLAIAAAGGPGGWAGWLAAAGLAGWAMMTASYLPMLRFYGLSPLRAPGLPLVATLYAAMTADSARRHHLGRGGAWKGRTIPARPAG